MVPITGVRRQEVAGVIKRRTAVLVTAAVLCGCSVQARLGYYEDDKRAAEAATVVLHQRLDKGEFEEIYEDADKALQATAPKADLVSAMKETRRKFGAFVKSEIKAASCFPNQVRFVCHTEYEKGPATEMMTWTVHDGKARLGLLNISPGLADVPPSAANDCNGKR
jgi:hypothetical protein